MDIETVVGVVKLCEPIDGGVQVVVQQYRSLLWMPIAPKACCAEATYHVPLHEFPDAEYSTVHQQLRDEEVFVLDVPTAAGRIASITVKSGPLRDRTVTSSPYSV